MAFAFVCRKLGPRGTSRKNESGLSPEFQRTRRVPSLSRHWRDVCASVLQCACVSCTHSHCRFGVRRRLPLQDLGCKRRRRPSQLVRERRRGQRAMARSTWSAQARSPLSVSAPLAHSLLPPCMTTVLRVLACRSGRVAQVPFSSACFWRGLHFRRAM